MRSKCSCWLRGGVGGQFPRNMIMIQLILLAVRLVKSLSVADDKLLNDGNHGH